ncbi:hypothetical protein HOG21_00385 [bacterium]|nr:hypothetical protein [bacterium]
MVFVYFNAKVVRLSFLEEYEEMKDIYDKIEEDIDDIDNLLENNKVMKKIKSNISVHTMVNTLYDK